MKVKCIRRCYHREKEWIVGETGNLPADDIPRHFEVVEEAPAEEAPAKPKGRKTM